MTDGPERSRNSERMETDRPVESLASEALRMLARKRGAGSKRMSRTHIDLLRDAVLHSDSRQRDDVMSSIRRDGVSIEDLIDLHIPEVARQLGEEWCRDETSFADVTIGAARLQGLLRDLLREMRHPVLPSKAAGVAVVVLADEYHTLGALILTAQLRRLGISVRLMVDTTPGDICDAIADGDRFDAIMISASHVETLVQLRNFVEKLKKQTSRNIPVVVGGPVIDAGIDVKAATGADFATSDVVEALRLCQLRISPHVIIANAKAG